MGPPRLPQDANALSHPPQRQPSSPHDAQLTAEGASLSNEPRERIELGQRTRSPPSSLFGTFVPSAASGFPLHGQETTAPISPGVNIADQVRFGFSHDPHFEPAQIEVVPVQQPSYGRDVAYPDAYLDRPTGGIYPEPQVYPNHSLQHQDQREHFHYDVSHAVPTSENFERGQWDMATQANAS